MTTRIPTMSNRILLILALALPLAAAWAGSARAETLRATLRFLDGDGAPAPIVFADVEVWRLDFPLWRYQRTVTTDANGFFSTVMPFAGTHTYALRVFATNPAAQVYTQDLYTQPFYR